MAQAGHGTTPAEAGLPAGQERLEEIASETAYFDAYCESGEAGRMALFESFGMCPARYSLEMAYVPFEDIPEPRFPPGIIVRAWVRGQDAEVVLAVFNEAFADHWDFIPVPLEEWLHWANTPRFRPELNLLAVAGEEIAGLCLCDVDEENIARIGRQEGWVDTLGVRRPYRHQGLGRALLLAGLHVLKEAGMESAMLGVDAESLTGATRLYESVGFVERKPYILYRRPL